MITGVLTVLWVQDLSICRCFSVSGLSIISNNTSLSMLLKSLRILNEEGKGAKRGFLLLISFERLSCVATAKPFIERWGWNFKYQGHCFWSCKEFFFWKQWLNASAGLKSWIQTDLFLQGIAMGTFNPTVKFTSLKCQGYEIT